jgi:GNAT superfamily N-acetyltransferase
VVDAAAGHHAARLMEIVIRRGTAEDAPALARLRWQWRADERNEAPGDVDRATFVDFFAGWVVDHLNTHLPYVAEVDGRLAGMAWLMLTDRVPSVTNLDRRFGDVQSVYVVPDLRNLGIGAALMDAVRAEARARELEFVTVHSSERAVPMYERSGFRGGQRWLELRE